MHMQDTDAALSVKIIRFCLLNILAGNLVTGSVKGDPHHRFYV